MKNKLPIALLLLFISWLCAWFGESWAGQSVAKGFWLIFVGVFAFLVGLILSAEWFDDKTQ